MIKKGLKVVVLAGKDRKKEGEVIEIDRGKNRAKVKEINSLIRENLDKDFLEILIRDKFVVGKKGENTYIIENE